MKFKEILPNISKWVAGIIAEEAVRTYGLSFVSAVAVLIIGIIESIDWFKLSIGIAVMFAAVSHGLLRIDEWRYRNQAKYKLVFHSMKIHKILSNKGAVAAIRLGYTLENKAMFPIQFEVVELETSINDLTPSKTEYENNKISIYANGSGWFEDHDINIPTQITNITVEGHLKSKLKYGRPGNLKYSLDMEKRLYFSFDNKGDIKNIEWHDIKPFSSE